MSEPRRMKPWRALRCPLCDHALHDGDHGIVLENGTIGCRVEMFVDIPQKLGTISSDDSHPQPPVGGEGVRAHDPPKDRAMETGGAGDEAHGLSDRARPVNRDVAGEVAHDRDGDLDLDGIRAGSRAGILAEEHRGKSQPAEVGDRRPLAEKSREQFLKDLPSALAYTNKIVVESDGYPMLHHAAALRTLLTNAFIAGQLDERAAGEARAAALQRERDELFMSLERAKALAQKQDDLAPLDVIWREKFESYAHRAEAAEAAIVSLQAPWKELGELLRFGTDDPYVLIGAVQALLTERPTAASSRSFAVDPDGGDSNT